MQLYQAFQLEGDEHSLPPWTPWMMTLNALRVALLSPQLLSYFL